MEIILQYFNGCPNWEVLDQRLAEVVNDRSDVRVIRQLVETPEDAVRLGFHGSPTVLVDGIDPFADEPVQQQRTCGSGASIASASPSDRGVVSEPAATNSANVTRLASNAR